LGLPATWGETFNSYKQLSNVLKMESKYPKEKWAIHKVVCVASEHTKPCSASRVMGIRRHHVFLSSLQTFQRMA
jgi:hypothetical protein